MGDKVLVLACAFVPIAIGVVAQWRVIRDARLKREADEWLVSEKEWRRVWGE
jgi:hypothetical protein